MSTITQFINTSNSFLSIDRILTSIRHITSQQKRPVVAISVAVALLYMINEHVLKPPKHFRHIPYFGYYSVLKSLFNGDSLFDRGHKVHLSVVNSLDRGSNGLYLEPGPRGWELNISNPADAKQILFKPDIFPKVDVVSKFEGTLLVKFGGGPNIFNSIGHVWKLQRQVVTPAFKRSTPVKLFGELGQNLFKALEGEEFSTFTVSKINVNKMLFRWTLDSIGRAGFGFDFEATKDINSKWAKAYLDIDQGLHDYRYFLLPFLDQKLLRFLPERRKVHEKVELFLKMIDEIIVKKRSALQQGLKNDDLAENERDMLTLMIESEMRGEGIMSNEEIKANLVMFFFAGHDTTSSSVSFILYHLAKHPDVQQKAREEAIRILGDTPEDIMPTMEETKQMTYINQVIKETLRLDSPAPRMVPRYASEDTVLSSGVVAPKGTLLSVNLYNIQHNEKYWKNPHEFDPDRFSEDGEATRAAGEGIAWLPFSQGGRICVGMNFSLIQQRVMVSMLLRKYSWTLTTDSIHKDGLITEGFPVVSPHQLDLVFTKLY